MKMLYYTFFCSLSLYGAAKHPFPTWEKMLAGYTKGNSILKQEMKEQLISDFVYAGRDPERQGEARMMQEIMHRCMNEHQHATLSKVSISTMLSAFITEQDDAYECAEKIRDTLSITNLELTDTKQILVKTAFTSDLNGPLSDEAARFIPACEDILCNASPEDLKEKVATGIISEDQIICCRHKQALVKLLAYALLSHQIQTSSEC